MNTTSFFQTMSDGTEISVTRWIPDGEVKGVVQLSHGMAEHSMRYDRLGSVFAENGYVLSAHDHRGHGRTAQKAEQKGTGGFGYLADRKGFIKIESDALEVLKKLKEDFPGKKTCLLGHSFGSFVAQALMEDYGNEYDCAILCGTAGPRRLLILGGEFLAFFNILFLGKKHKSNFLNKISFGSYLKHIENPGTDFDWLSKSEMNVNMYMADQWCGFVPSAGFFRDMYDGFTKIHKRRNMKKIPKSLPVLFIYGKEDPVGDYGKTVELLAQDYRDNGMQDITVIPYETLRHEIFNEVESDKVIADCLDWISKRLD